MNPPDYLPDPRDREGVRCLVAEIARSRSRALLRAIRDAVTLRLDQLEPPLSRDYDSADSWEPPSR